MIYLNTKVNAQANNSGIEHLCKITSITNKDNHNNIQEKQIQEQKNECD